MTVAEIERYEREERNTPRECLTVAETDRAILEMYETTSVSTTTYVMRIG